jgi:hypothetical protein
MTAILKVEVHDDGLLVVRDGFDVDLLADDRLAGLLLLRSTIDDEVRPPLPSTGGERPIYVTTHERQFLHALADDWREGRAWGGPGTTMRLANILDPNPAGS